MSKFINLMLKNWMFLQVFNSGSIDILNSFDVPKMEKITEDRFEIRDFKLDDSLVFREVVINEDSDKLLDPAFLFGFSFIIDSDEMYNNADYYFDSKNNDTKEVDAIMRGRGSSKLRYSDRIDGYDYYIPIRIVPMSYDSSIYYHLTVSVYRDTEEKYKLRKMRNAELRGN